MTNNYLLPSHDVVFLYISIQINFTKKNIIKNKFNYIKEHTVIPLNECLRARTN